MRQPAGRVLTDVADIEPEVAAVAHGRRDGGSGVADHDPHVGDPGAAQGLQTVEEDRLVGDGKKLLGRGVGDREESPARPSRQDQSLHAAEPSATPRTNSLPSSRDGTIGDADLDTQHRSTSRSSSPLSTAAVSAYRWHGPPAGSATSSSGLSPSSAARSRPS